MSRVAYAVGRADLPFAQRPERAGQGAEWHPEHLQPSVRCGMIAVVGIRTYRDDDVPQISAAHAAGRHAAYAGLVTPEAPARVAFFPATPRAADGGRTDREPRRRLPSLSAGDVMAPGPEFS